MMPVPAFRAGGILWLCTPEWGKGRVAQQSAHRGILEQLQTHVRKELERVLVTLGDDLSGHLRVQLCAATEP